MAIMQLVEQGRILLADPLSKCIPAFADTKVGAVRDGELTLVTPDRPITIQDLLRHTSGLTYDFVGGGEHPVQKLYAQANLARPDQTNADQVDALAKLPLMNQPGTTWDYSRSTDVLGRIVEIVTGKSLGVALEEQILGPLGMKDTAFSVAEKNFDRIAEPLPIDQLPPALTTTTTTPPPPGDGTVPEESSTTTTVLEGAPPDAAPPGIVPTDPEKAAACH